MHWIDARNLPELLLPLIIFDHARATRSLGSCKITLSKLTSYRGYSDTLFQAVLMYQTFVYHFSPTRSRFFCLEVFANQSGVEYRYLACVFIPSNLISVGGFYPGFNLTRCFCSVAKGHLHGLLYALHFSSSGRTFTFIILIVIDHCLLVAINFRQNESQLT
jgi:hypothetical protein